MKLNIREAAAMLNVPETKLYRWVDDGEIPFVTIQHHPLFHRLELLEWAMERDLPISVDLYEDSTEAPLATALERGGGHVTSGGGDVPIADALPIDAGDRDVIAAVIAARGRELFQDRGAIAIPRPRSTLICPELPPTVMLWWSSDAAPIKATFAIVTPTVLDHLQLLSRLSLVLRDDAFAAAVDRREPFATVVAEARRVEQALAGSEAR